MNKARIGKNGINYFIKIREHDLNWFKHKINSLNMKATDKSLLWAGVRDWHKINYKAGLNATKIILSSANYGSDAISPLFFWLFVTGFIVPLINQKVMIKCGRICAGIRMHNVSLCFRTWRLAYAVAQLK